MRRLWVIFCLFILLFSVIIARLFHWQVISGEKLKKEAQSQYALQFSIPAQRGTIAASDGNPIVLSTPAYLLYAEPRKIKDPRTFLAKIAEFLPTDASEFLSQLTDGTRAWVPIAHKVDHEVAQSIRTLNLAGLGFEKEPKRYYPEASMAAQLLGFVGSDANGDDRGYFGLEGYYNRELSGKEGLLSLEKDARGNPILIGEARRIEPENGRSLVLWLDRAIQSAVERRLAEGIRKYGAKEGSVVIVDPKTGGVLAMASYPSYDPRRFADSDKTLYKNPIVAGTYEPGSTFKVFIMSAALEEKLVTPTMTMNETGPLAVGEHTIRTWNDTYNGTISMSKVLEKSSNVGMVFVARLLGREKELAFIKRFGFGSVTNVDLEEEATPELRPESEWREIDLATASFGQGIAVTPIQMVRAVSAFANDGWLVEPHIVKEIRDNKGRTIPIRPKKLRQVISAATAKIITEMMVTAVENGEAKWAKPKGYRIAGKTGTAQIPVAGHYDEEKTIASFVGFAPADDPKFAMLVTLREPISSPWGSETAAPLFFAIARDIFSYFGIAPE